MTTHIKVHFHEEKKFKVLPLIAETINKSGRTVGYLCKSNPDGNTPATEWFPADTTTISCEPVPEKKYQS